MTQDSVVTSVEEIPATIAEDLLIGASAIAAWLYNDPKKRKKIYYLAQKTNFPHFKMGSKLHARKSVLRHWWDAQERRQTPVLPRPTRRFR
jgi:hypothetical protein